MRALVFGDAESSQTRTIIISVVVTVVVTLAVTSVLIVVLAFAFKRKDKVRAENGDYIPLSRKELPTESLPDICGLTILEQEVFISRLVRPDVEVYDATTFDFKRRMAVDGMTNPENIVSCTINNYLYAVDWRYQKQFPAILRIDPTNGNLINTWNIDRSGGRISIASDTNVVLNINHEAMLNEYTADGELIRKINLSSGTDITEVRHAVKLPNGRFVVCHCGSYGDPLGRVCLISTKATTTTVERIDEVEILATYGAEQREPIYRSMRPKYLSVNKDGLILVSDALNKHTVLLSSDLKELQILVSQKHGMGSPLRTCFYESTGQWFVADNHRVMVCRVKDEGVERKPYELISR